MRKTIKYIATLMVSALLGAPSALAAEITLNLNDIDKEFNTADFDKACDLDSSAGNLKDLKKKQWQIKSSNTSVVKVSPTEKQSYSTEQSFSFTLTAQGVGNATLTILAGSSGVSNRATLSVEVVDGPSELKFEYGGVNFTVEGATTNYVDGDLVMTFTESGSMKTEGGEIKNASLLVVGGGGGGGTGDNSTDTPKKRLGSGGDGGYVEQRDANQTLPAATYTITVGAGGPAKNASGSKAAGNNGSPSSISASGFTTVQAGGGNGGDGDTGAEAKHGTDRSVTSYISGPGGVTYSKAGKAAASETAEATDAAPNTGNGGDGCGGYTAGKSGSTSGSTRPSGAGGSGVVIVRIPPQGEKPVVDNAYAGTLTYGDKLSAIAAADIAVTMKDASGNQVAGTFAWVDGSKTKMPTVADSNKTQYNVVFTPTDSTKYQKVTVPAFVTVNPKSVTVTAEDKTVRVGSAKPTTFTATYDGFVNGETADKVLTTTPSFACAYTKSAAVGSTWPITPSGAAAANYTFAYVPGTLTVIDKAPAEKFADLVTVTGGSMDTTTDENSLIIKYTDTATTGTLVIPEGYNVTARILVVGGGGAGIDGSGSSSYSKKYGTGGNGGKGSDSTYDMPTGKYTVTVGAGGTSNGSAGNDSSIGGVPDFTPITGEGASKQTDTTHSSAVAGSDGFAQKTSDITGASLPYGKGASKSTTNTCGKRGDDNTGNGGVGGYGGESVGGAGGSGIVIVRITAMVPMKEVIELNPVALEVGESVSVEAPTADGEILSRSFDNTVVSVAAGIESGMLSISVTGLKVVDSTDVKVETENKFYVLPVTVIPAPDKTEFKGRIVKTFNAATVERINDDKELLITFTDTSKTGTLIIPEDATARILLVGGGAGGLGSYLKTDGSPTSGYGSNGGNGGSVVEKKLEDGFILPQGSYTITVGKGGDSVAGIKSGKEYWNLNEPGSESSLVGGDIEPLVAAGGAAFDGKPQTTKIEDKIEDGPQADDMGAISAKTKNQYYAHDGRGAGAADGEKFDKTGVTSDITGPEVTYGVGGAGGASGNGTSWAEADGDPGTPANSGNGGAGGSNGGSGGAGAAGRVIVRLTYTDPVYVETCTIAPLLKGDQLSNRLITLVMTNAEGVAVSGAGAWKDPTLSPTVSGEQTIVFTPEDTTAYSITEIPVSLIVVDPLESSETLAINVGGTIDATKTETASANWTVVVSAGAEFIETPTWTLDGDNRLTLTVTGKDDGVAYVDLYDGTTFVKRNVIAVLADPAEDTVAVSVEEDDSTTVTTTTTGSDWSCLVQVGSQRVLASVAKNGDNTATLTVAGLAAGTAIVDIFDGETIVKRATVTVVGPTEGRASVVVAKDGTTTVKTEAAIASVTYFSDSTGICTVPTKGTTTTIKGIASGEAELRFYAADNTLVKIVKVLVVDSLDTYNWNNKTIKYYGAAMPTTVGNDLLFAFTSEAGALELPLEAVADILVVGGGASGAAGGTENSTTYRGNGGGGGKAIYEEKATMPQGAYVLAVGRGAASVSKPASGRVAVGGDGNGSSLSNGADFDQTAAGGSSGKGCCKSSSTPSDGLDGAALECSITGTPVTYGQNGTGATQNSGTAGAAGTVYGQGGQGGHNSASGAGKDGVIYVRLKGFIETPVPAADGITGTVIEGNAFATTVWTGTMMVAGTKVAGGFAWATLAADAVAELAASGSVADVIFTPDDTTFFRPTQVPATLVVLQAKAQVGGRNYASVQDAVDAATTMAGGDPEVKVLVDTDEKVVIPEGSSVKINNNGHETGEITNNGEMEIEIKGEQAELGSGTVDYPVKGNGGISVKTTDTSKETSWVRKDENTITITVQTSTAIMKQVAPDGSKALDANTDALRTFCTDNGIEAYTKANTSAEEIGAALQDSGENTLPLWQDYVMGIEPTDPIDPVTVPTGDKDEEKITLSVPAIAAATPSGDYVIAYKVVDKDGKEDPAPQAPGAIKIPLETGTYTINAVLTPAN